MSTMEENNKYSSSGGLSWWWGIGRYLLWVRYRSDAERKRLEGALARHSGEARISKPAGALYIVEADDIEPLIRDLYARLDPGIVEVYRLGGVEEPEPSRAEKKYFFPQTSPEKTWGYIEMLMLGLRAALVSETSAARRYVVYGKRWGRAEIEVSVTPVQGGSLAYIRVTGYRGVDKIMETVDKSLSPLSRVARREEGG